METYEDSLKISKKIVDEVTDVFNKNFNGLDINQAFAIGMESIKFILILHIKVCLRDANINDIKNILDVFIISCDKILNNSDKVTIN